MAYVARMAVMLRVRIPSGEVEIQGTQSEINKTIDKLPEIVDKVREALAGSPSGIERGSEFARARVSLENTESAPSIEKASGLNDAISKLLSTEWGKKPRKWSELDQALAQNALNYSRGSITGALAYLVKSGRLRRLLLNGVYAYQLPPQSILAQRREVRQAESITTTHPLESPISEPSIKHGKAETSIILQQIESKLIPQSFFIAAKSTGDVRAELEQRLGLEFQSRKVSQALGELYEREILKRTGSKGNFRYIIT